MYYIVIIMLFYAFEKKIDRYFLQPFETHLYYNIMYGLIDNYIKK